MGDLVRLTEFLYAGRYNPVMLPKVRNSALLDACRYMPCTLRIASFVPGMSCSGRDTVVPCHCGNVGKGMSTRVSDMTIAAGCHTCHDILDGRRENERDYIMEKYPAAVMHRIMSGVFETQAMLVEAGLIVVPGAEIIK